MKTNKDSLDALIYVLACILTLGFWYIVRIVISTAIRKALEE